MTVERRSLVAGAAAAAVLAASGFGPAMRARAQSATRIEPEQAPAKDGLADLPGVKLYYWDTGGTGEAVIFLHAGTGSALSWGYQQPVFAKAGYRAIGYSRRGFYKSQSVAGSTPDDDIEDLKNLLDALKIGKAHIVGTAAGAILATPFGLKYPDRILSLTLACSVMGVQDPDYLKTGNLLRPEPFGKMPPDFRELGPSYRAQNRAGVARWLELEHLSRGGQAPPPPPANPPPNANPVTWARLATLKPPVLLLCGDADLYTPPSMLREIASHIPGSEMQVIDEAGHSAYWEQPETFNRLVLDFIGRHKGA